MMTAIRYVGTSAWNQAHYNDKGVYTHSKPVQPGETVDVDKAVAEHLLQGPRSIRVFVEANGPEDHYGDHYKASALEAVQGNATPYPALDMGSTVQSGRTITRTEDDNEEGFALAHPDEGPRSDNTAVNEAAEVQAEADKAAERKRTEQAKARQTSSRQTDQRKSEG